MFGIKLNRESSGWTLAAVGALVTYLMANTPPIEWDYYRWLSFIAFVVAYMSGKMDTSPLPAKAEVVDADKGKVEDPSRFRGGPPIVLLFVAVMGLGAVSLPACASARAANTAPASLGSTAKVKWHGERVIRAIDVLRDIAVSAHANGLMAERDTRSVVEWHRSVLEVIHAAPTGWESAVSTGLAGVVGNLPPAQQQQLRPYVTLVQELLREASGLFNNPAADAARGSITEVAGVAGGGVR